MARHGKRYNAAREAVDSAKVYDASDAFALVKTIATAKFDEAVEAHLILNIDPKKGEQQVRSAAVLPHGTGKSIRVAVATTTKIDEATKAGAVRVGAEDIVEEIRAGKIDWDVLVATPDMMPKLAPVAKILGPRGLMPSPKTDTVTTAVAQTVAELSKGKVNFKNDQGGIVHQMIGRASFSAEQLFENFSALCAAVRKQKTSAHKGALISAAYVTTTMSPSVRVKI